MSPALEQTLVGLLPVVTGGILAALGGAFGALITHRLAASREIQMAERATLERIATLAFEYSAWLERRLSANLFQRIDFREKSPLDELKMLVSLYFPSLRPEMSAVTKAGLDCFKWVNATWSEQQKDLNAWINKPNNMDSYYPFAEVLINNIAILVESVRKNLPK
jgi:hypothetical protein